MNLEEQLQTPSEFQNPENLTIKRNGVIYEFMGQFIFIFFSLNSIACLVLYPFLNITWLSISITWSLALYVGLECAIQGGTSHLNPVVSFIVYLSDINFTFRDLIKYTIAQILASAIASASVYGIHSDSITLNESTAFIFITQPFNKVSHTSAFFVEFIGTFILLISILTSKCHKIVCITLGLLILTMPHTNFSLNPARSLGPAIFLSIANSSPFSYNDNYIWIPVIAPYLGAIFAYIIYKCFEYIKINI